MRTVQPSIMIGSYAWDQDRLPHDEFQIRTAALHRVMDERSLAAILIYGDAAEHSALAYFSNFIPRLRWGMALFSRTGEPRVLGSMSPRDIPAMKLMTFIPDVLSGWNLESAFDPWLARLEAAGPLDIGGAGFTRMRPALFRSVEKSLGNRFRLHAVDEALAAARAPRPREHSQIRDAVRVMQAGCNSFLQAWSERAGTERAALAAERRARLLAAQDVRTLMSFDSGRTLVPGRGTFGPQAGALAGYLAVKHRGYWAETFVNAAPAPGTPAADMAQADDLRRRVHDARDALVEAVRPGVAASRLHAIAMQALGNLTPHPVVGSSMGRRIGLALNEGGTITRDATHALAPGEVYAFHVGAHDAGAGAIASAMVLVTGSGRDLMHRSPAGIPNGSEAGAGLNATPPLDEPPAS